MQTANASRVAVAWGEIQEGHLPTSVQAVAAVNTREEPVRQILDIWADLSLNWRSDDTQESTTTKESCTCHQIQEVLIWAA